MYLDLMKRVLTNVIYRDPAQPAAWYRGNEYDQARRAVGGDWPSTAHTMVGLERLDNVQACAEAVIADHVPGDFIETGVWRGGVCILMRAVLRAYGVADRTVWVADSFVGLPDTGNEGHPLDRDLALHRHNDVLAISLDEVRNNFDRYGLLDGQVRFLSGWFRDTLPGAPIERLAVLRLDGDLHLSTMDALTNLYPKLSVGGYAIIDDYEIAACRQAVHEYRDAYGIDEPIVPIGDNGVYWRRSA